MAQPDFDALAPRTRRRLLLQAVVRALLTVTLLVVLYYTLPMDHAFDTVTIILLLVGLLVFAALVAWQVRAILRSDYPAVQAVQALAAAIPLFLLLFASTHFLTGRDEPGTFTESFTRTDALYFTVTIFATVGFGDITAVNPDRTRGNHRADALGPDRARPADPPGAQCGPDQPAETGRHPR